MRLKNNLDRSQGGFTLVELLVGLSLGLIVIGAVLALVVSMMRTSAQSVSAIRLTQEARTLADLVSREIRRARFDGDYVEYLGRGKASTGKFSGMSVAPTCVKFGYDENGDGAIGAGEFKSIWYDTASKYLMLNTFATFAGTTCSGGSRIGSNDIQVEALVFSAQPTPTAFNQFVLMDFVVAKKNDVNVKRNFKQVISLRNFDS